MPSFPAFGKAFPFKAPCYRSAIERAQLYRSCELPNKMFVGSEIDKAVSRRYNLNIQARTVQPERCQDVRIIIQLHDHCPYSDWTRIEQGRGGSLLTPNQINFAAKARAKNHPTPQVAPASQQLSS